MKQAAKQLCDFTPTLPPILHSLLPHNKSARKTTYTKQRKKEQQALFHASPRYDKMHAIDPKAPSSDYREITTDLSRHQSSILIQLRTGHAQLNQHLHNIGATTTQYAWHATRKKKQSNTSYYHAWHTQNTDKP